MLLRLLAESPVDTLNWVQLASSLGFAGLSWYLICYQMPRQNAEYRAELAEERKGRKDEREHWTARLREQESECLAERREWLAEIARLRSAIDSHDDGKKG